MLVGAVLRLDALFESFGPYEQPGWLARMQPTVTTAASALTPDRWRWRHVDDPYSGDPHNYLRFAREMRHFYQAHVREPLFLAATRVSLTLTNDADVAVSLASIAFSLLASIAAYLVGRQIASPAAALAAAAVLAIDYTAIATAIEGWRDELFASLVILSAWAWIRLSRQPSYSHAALAGIIGAAACLTRLTAITCLVPAWLWFMAQRPAGSASLRIPLLAAAVTLALVAPYLISCAIETGDPLYAINYHTQFYLEREGAADRTPRSAVRYTLGKFERHPLATADTALIGVAVHPFTNKWDGLHLWHQHLGRTLSWLALAGIFGWLWHPAGRLLLLMLAGSLVPYMLTWGIRGGSEWRFTFVAYPFYLLAAFWMVDCTARLIWEARQNGTAALAPYIDRKRALQMAVALVVTVAAAWSWALFMPYFIARESLIAGEPAALLANERGGWLFADGWSDPVVTGDVVARFATEPIASVRIPLPEARAYDLTLRMDPLNYHNAPQQTVHVAINETAVAEFQLTFDGNRVGEYRTHLPAHAIRPGLNRITLRSNVMAPVGRAGRAFRTLPGDQLVGVRLWYVLITPVEAPSSS